MGHGAIERPDEEGKPLPKWRPGLIERSFFNGRTRREEAQLGQDNQGYLIVRDLVRGTTAQYQNHDHGYKNALAHYEQIVAERVSNG